MSPKGGASHGLRDAVVQDAKCQWQATPRRLQNRSSVRGESTAVATGSFEGLMWTFERRARGISPLSKGKHKSLRANEVFRTRERRQWRIPFFCARNACRPITFSFFALLCWDPNTDFGCVRSLRAKKITRFLFTVPAGVTYTRIYFRLLTSRRQLTWSNHTISLNWAHRVKTLTVIMHVNNVLIVTPAKSFEKEVLAPEKLVHLHL